MSFLENNTVTAAIKFAVEHGVIVDGKFSRSCKMSDLRVFTDMIKGATQDPSEIKLDSWRGLSVVGTESGLETKEINEKLENMHVEALDSLDNEDYVSLMEPAEDVLMRLDCMVGNTDRGEHGMGVGTCFSELCSYLMVSCDQHCQRVEELTDSMCSTLAKTRQYKVAYKVYGKNDSRNHVMPVHASTPDSAVQLYPAHASFGDERIVGVVRAADFFKKDGRFSKIKFFAEGDSHVDMSDIAFGGDSASRQPSRGHPSGSSGHQPSVRPPVSVVDEEQRSGSANVNGGVTRSARRVIKARGTHDTVYSNYRSYGTVGTTMFNNIEEMYLNTISREYAQEIMEELFRVWGLPTNESSTMQYAEDLLWAFLIARTASNKADYNVEYDIPTKSGSVLADFSKLHVLLEDKYGLTRRNFARGVANDLRSYINREENQFLKSRCAHRVGADPQYGSLCFDGSTGCTGVTSSEATFTRLLEGRNLYEREDILAEGASERLMQGIHGGVRSIVQR